MPDKKKYDSRLNVYVTAELHHKLEQVRDQRGPKVTVPDIVREAIRLYIDNEEDIIGSRRHFQRNLREALDEAKSELIWQQIVLLAFLWQSNGTLSKALDVTAPSFKDNFHQALAFAVTHWDALMTTLQTNREDLLKRIETRKK